MTATVDFSYRLPLTYVRVTGTRTSTTDLDKTMVVCKAAVTTELAADWRTKLDVSMSAEAMAKQKSTWNLTSDGRLTGADVSTTVEPMAGLSTALKAGATVLGLAGPALLAAGPPGWIALAGAVGATSLLAGAAVDGGLGIFAEGGDGVGGGGFETGDLGNANPSEWEVHPQYVEKDAAEAQTLANLRCALTTAERKYAQVALAAAQATTLAEQMTRDEQLRQLQRLLASTSAGAARAEARYAAWVALRVTTTTVNCDYRFRCDQMPTEERLTAWAEDLKSRTGRGPWVDALENLNTAVSVDLEEIAGDNGIETLTNFTGSGDHQVYFRPPRPAIVKVWAATPNTTAEETLYTLKLVDLRRLQVSVPGNEAAVVIEAGDRASSAVAVTFDETGALTKVTAEIGDPRLQRAKDIGGLLDTLTSAVTTGKDLREALAPPSLVDQAAEAKAAAELGLDKSDADPLKELKAQVAEQQLRAQLALAEQLQKANSIPVLVAVTQSTE